MDSINWKITALCSCIALASCSSDNNAVVVPENGPVATDEPFEGLRVIGDKDRFEASIRQALINSANGGNDIGQPVDVALESGAPPPASPDAAPSTDSADAGADLQVTETNVQEVGVDEADRIKSDGEFLYVLNINYGNTDLPVPGQPVPEPEPVALQQRTSIAYEPSGKAQIRILSLDHEAASANLLHTVEMDTSGQSADGLYLYQTESDQSLIVTSSSMNGYWGYWGNPYKFRGQRSTVHKIDIMAPATARVSDSLELDGQIVSSRRIGDYLYVVTRYFPWMEVYPVDGQGLEESVNNTPIEDLLPKATRASDGSQQALADASRCFVASRPESGYYSPDIVTLAVIDLKSVSISDSVCYLGASETLYASTNAVYLATTEWNNYATEDTAVSPPGEEPAVAPEPDFNPATVTSVHQFDIQAGKLAYRGTGKVNGHLGWDPARKPYRMSEHGGDLRVVTYDELQNGSRSPVTMSVLRPGAERRLNLISQLPNQQRPQHIGKPGERLYASRFLGDKAYLVTFRQIDPLYVIDLSDAADPYIAGELEIEGYSDYLRPIGNDHLLGIGRGAIPANGVAGADRGAFAQGIKVSLFNIANPASPLEVQSLEIGKRGSQSNALYDPHAITVMQGADGQASRLAIGIDVNDIPNSYSSGPAGWYDWRETGLFGFEIKTDANAGITQHGSMIVESRSSTQNYGPSRYDDRSVIVNDAVFYIHGEQVFGANWNALGSFAGPW